MTLSLADSEFDTSSNHTHSISLPKGNYISICKTLGSNPAAVIYMYLDGVEIGTNETSVRPKAPRLTLSVL